MALVKDPVARARKASTPLQAARLRETLEMEVALNETIDPDWEREADDAIDLLNQRFGRRELDQVDTPGQGTKGWTPGLSRGARRGEEGPQRSGKANGTRTPRRGGGGRQQARTASRRPSTRRRRGGGRGLSLRSRTFEQTGIPGAARSTTALGLQLLGLMIGLSLLYLVLSRANVNAPGWRFIEQGLARASGAVYTFIQPTDPLNPGPRTYEQRLAAGQVAGPPAPVVPLAPRRAARERRQRSAASP